MNFIKSMKLKNRIIAIFLCLALVLTGASATFANVGSADSLVASEAINNEDIQTSKTVVYDEETDSYKLVVESYVTGQTTTVTVDSTKATDFVISLDTSHSMVDCINCGTTPVESKSTAKPTGNYTSCKIYAPDLDYGETYYRGTNGSGAVTYCTECEGWFEASHREDGAHGSIDDVRYLPWESASSKDSTIARIGNTTFYEDHICTEDCDEECALAGTRVPVYTTDPEFSTSKKYFRDPNVKNTAVTYVCEYCDICEKWVSNYHCTGGTVRNPESYTFYENHVCTEECLEECELAGKRVVVDTTSPDFSTEKEYYRDANVSHTSATYVIRYCSMCQRWISNTHGHSASTGDERIPYERGTYGKTVYDLFHIPCVSLLKGAKNAIEAFIDEVYEKSKGPDGISGTDDDVHHRVALTGFSGGPSNGQMKIDYRPYSGNWTRSGIFSVWNSDLEEAAQWYENTGYDGSIETQNFVSYWNIDSTTNKTELARAEYFYSHALRDVTSEIERAVLAEGMEDYAYEYGTETHHGVRMANEIFEHNLDPNRNRVYVLFTDGEPSDNARDPALKAASGIKNHEDYTATIYTIGTFAKSSSDNIYPLPSQSTNKFLTLLSSNFTNNTSIGKNAAGKSYK